MRRAEFRRDAGDFAGALSDLSSILQHDPENVEANYVRAGVRMLQGKPGLALSEITQSLQAHPDSARLFTVRALVHFELEQFEEGIDDAAEGIRLEKEFAPPYAIRSMLEFMLGDLAAAEAFAKLATELDPYLPQPYYVRGRILDQQGEFGQASQKFDQAIALNPIWLPPVAWHALTQGHAGFYQTAREELERAADRFQGQADAHVFLAWFLATCPQDSFRDGTRAVAEARKALALSRESMAALEVMAAALAESGDFAQALLFESKAMDKTPAASSSCARMKGRFELFVRRLPYRDYHEGF